MAIELTSRSEVRSVVPFPAEPAAGPAPGGSRSGTIRVLVVDDHALFRRGLQMVLGAEPDIEVVGEASDGASALRVALELQPDVVLLDIRMPGGQGTAVCESLRRAVPGCRVAILTMSDAADDLYDAIRAGASGYLLKEISAEEVATSVRAIAGGQSLVSPSMAAKLMGDLGTGPRPAPARPSAASRLTRREIEVLELVATGASNRVVGNQLGISENTVKNHVRNILEKLELHSRMEAVLFAAREKLLDLG